MDILIIKNMFRKLDWFKVYFSLTMGFLIGIIESSYIFLGLRGYGIHITIEIFGVIWGSLTFINGYIFYKIINYIESKLV